MLVQRESQNREPAGARATENSRFERLAAKMLRKSVYPPNRTAGVQYRHPILVPVPHEERITTAFSNPRRLREFARPLPRSPNSSNEPSAPIKETNRRRHGIGKNNRTARQYRACGRQKEVHTVIRHRGRDVSDGNCTRASRSGWHPSSRRVPCVRGTAPSPAAHGEESRCAYSDEPSRGVSHVTPATSARLDRTSE